jgi:hypothetical protein
VVRARVYIRSFNDCCAQRARLFYGRVERAQLEPEQHAKTVRCRARFAKVWMAMNVPGVKLENDFAVLDDLLVFIAAMTALATEQLLVPTAAALHIAHGDQRLSFHADLVRACDVARRPQGGQSRICAVPTTFNLGTMVGTLIGSRMRATRRLCPPYGLLRWANLATSVLPKRFTPA